MAYILSAQRDTSRKNAAAPRVQIWQEDTPCHDLRQIGQVHNNLISYRGVFATEAEAQEAARSLR